MKTKNIILIVLVITILPFTLYGKSEKPLNSFKIKINDDSIQLRCVKGREIAYSLDKSTQLNTTVAKKPKDLANFEDYESQTSRYFKDFQKDGYPKILKDVLQNSLNNGNQLNKNNKINGWMILNVNEKGEIFKIELRFRDKTYLYATLHDIYEALINISKVKLKPIDYTYRGINRAYFVFQF